MSKATDALIEIKAAAIDLGIPTLAAKSGIKEDTLRRFLKKPPTSVRNFMTLTAIAELHHKPTAPDAAEIG